MNERQRRKHRRGEFRQLGFELRFRTPRSWSRAERAAFADACIDRIEAVGLAVGGGTGERWDVYVTTLAERGSVTPAQRQALLDWLAANPAVLALAAGALEDAWYPPAVAGDPAD